MWKARNLEFRQISHFHQIFADFSLGSLFQPAFFAQSPIDEKDTRIGVYPTKTGAFGGRDGPNCLNLPPYQVDTQKSMRPGPFLRKGTQARAYNEPVMEAAVPTLQSERLLREPPSDRFTLNLTVASPRFLEPGRRCLGRYAQ
jgi:hypothetical protein